MEGPKMKLYIYAENTVNAGRLAPSDRAGSDDVLEFDTETDNIEGLIAAYAKRGGFYAKVARTLDENFIRI
jgi:hypothetical protein